SWGETSVVRCRTCTADVRVAHHNKRCHSEVGAPVKQDCRAAQRRHMSRRPRTETSPWYVDPWSPLSPSIPENHSVDERSMRGVYPGSRADTKLGVCHLRSAILSPLEIQRSVSATFRGVLCHPCASPYLRVCRPMTSTPSPCRETRCARAPPGVAGR